MTLFKILRVGKSQAVRAALLGQSFDMGFRQIQRWVRKERREGVPIVSGHDGYWLAPTRYALKRYALRLRARGMDAVKTADIMLDNAGRFATEDAYKEFLYSRTVDPEEETDEYNDYDFLL